MRLGYTPWHGVGAYEERGVKAWRSIHTLIVHMYAACAAIGRRSAPVLPEVRLHAEAWRGSMVRLGYTPWHGVGACWGGGSERGVPSTNQHLASILAPLSMKQDVMVVTVGFPRVGMLLQLLGFAGAQARR